MNFVCILLDIREVRGRIEVLAQHQLTIKWSIALLASKDMSEVINIFWVVKYDKYSGPTSLLAMGKRDLLSLVYNPLKSQ